MHRLPSATLILLPTNTWRAQLYLLHPSGICMFSNCGCHVCSPSNDLEAPLICLEVKGEEASPSPSLPPTQGNFGIHSPIIHCPWMSVSISIHDCHTIEARTARKMKDSSGHWLWNFFMVVFSGCSTCCLLVLPKLSYKNPVLVRNSIYFPQLLAQCLWLITGTLENRLSSLYDR